MSVLYCFRTGQIAVSSELPAKALAVAVGSDVLLVQAMRFHAEPCTRTRRLIVPEIAAAKSNDMAHAALERLRLNVQTRLDQWRAEDALALGHTPKATPVRSALQ